MSEFVVRRTVGKRADRSHESERAFSTGQLLGVRGFFSIIDC